MKNDMEPIKFKEQNAVYVADGCGDLPAHKADNQIISCWQLTPQEIEKINQTGVLWLSIFGQGQPPILLSVDTLFVGADEPDEEIPVKDKMQSIAKGVEYQLPSGYGFIVFAYPHNKLGEVVYASNSDRDGATEILQKYLNHLKGQTT